MPTPKCIDWLELIENGVSVLDRLPTNSRLRIDSFGQRDEVLAGLIRIGGSQAYPQSGEIRSLNHQYAGLCGLLKRLNDWSGSRQDVMLDQNPLDIATMFDKWAAHQRLVPHRPRTHLLPAEGVENETTTPGKFIARSSSLVSSFRPLPESTWRRLKEIADDCGGRVFIKPRYASSASGVCCLRVIQNRQQLIAPIEIVRDSGSPRLFNSLKMRSFTKFEDIHDILSVLVPQGMIVEQAVNKARIDGDRFDLRIVVIDGRAEHIVVRQSPWPITNLHLGNRRGSLDAVARFVGQKRLEACRELAIHAANQFPQSLHCGVDVLLPKRGEPLICETNAFGDFLPNLVGGGRTVYEAILEAGLRPTEAPV